MESGVRRENRKDYVDELAAIFILQGYLDAQRIRKEMEDAGEEKV